MSKQNFHLTPIAIAVGVNPEAIAASKSGSEKRRFSRKSTSTLAQYERVLIMLRSGKKNTLEFRRAGIMAPAARIKELNDNYGAYIPTVSTVNIVDEWGFSHKGIAVYELIDEPKGLA